MESYPRPGGQDSGNQYDNGCMCAQKPFFRVFEHANEDRDF